MNNFKYSRILAFFFGSLLFFSACKKDSDPTYEPPVTEPLTITSAILGDTIIIKGQNFSEVASENVVKFNGVEAVVVSATATELVVVVPANATSGSVTVTVHGHTVEIGSLTVMPFTLYCAKDNSGAGNYYRQIISIAPADGRETVLATLNDYTEFDVFTAKYIASTNELVGLHFSGDKLSKFNLGTKQASTVPLPGNGEYGELVTDRSGNLYATLRKWNTLNVLIVKIDPKTGAVETVTELGQSGPWALVYLPATNEIAGLWDDERQLFKLNLTTKATSVVRLTDSPALEYKYMVVANSELYGAVYEMSGNGYLVSLTKINPATGAVETVLGPSLELGNLSSPLVYDPQRKEIISLWNGGSGLYRFNTKTKTSSILTLTTSQDIWYKSLSSN